MGRVEEALRRAAEADATHKSQPESAAGVIDVAFPAEEEQVASASMHSESRGANSSLEAEARSAETPVHLTSEVGDDAAGLDAASTAPSTPSQSTKLVGDQRMLTTSREQYRRLAASLHHIQAVSGLKVVLIASALAGEGKTLTAANLALTFSESYERSVLLIDADLRRPSLARTFGIEASPGLSDGLLRGFQGPLPVHQVSERLTVLPAGKATPDPMAALTSERMRQLVAEARESFDWVIVDTPPIGLMTDASLLSAIADGTVLVVKANSTPYQMVERAIQALGPDRVIGAVLNRAVTKSHGDKYYDYYQYAPAPETAETE